MAMVQDIKLSPVKAAVQESCKHSSREPLANVATNLREGGVGLTPVQTKSKMHVFVLRFIVNLTIARLKCFHELIHLKQITI